MKTLVIFIVTILSFSCFASAEQEYKEAEEKLINKRTENALFKTSNKLQVRLDDLKNALTQTQVNDGLRTHGFIKTPVGICEVFLQIELMEQIRRARCISGDKVTTYFL